MQGAKRSITSRVTIKNPRPRKYASAAEKQAAFRARFPTICVRVEPKTAETVQAVADASGRTQQETLLSMLKYAMTNRNWLTLGLTEHKQLPRKENPIMLPQGSKEKDREAIKQLTDYLADQLRSSNFSVEVNQSGSIAGPSNYLKISDPLTGRFIAKPIRISTHSKGPFEAGNVLDIGTKQEADNVIEVALNMRAQGPSELMQRDLIIEQFVKKKIAEGMKPKQAYKLAFEQIEDLRKANPMKRKPTPAQIAARERFAAMARSGAFKKKAAKARKKNPLTYGLDGVVNITDTYERSVTSSRNLAEHYANQLRMRGRDDIVYVVFGITPEAKAQAGRYRNGVTITLDPRDYEIAYAFHPTQGEISRQLKAQRDAERRAFTRQGMKLKSNPAKKTVSQKISQLTREGYPQRQAVAIALSEERAGKVRRNPIERYELRRLDKTNALDSTYKTLTHAKSALDEIDRPPASFYVIDTETGKPHFSFQAQTKFPGIEIRGTAMQKAYKRNPRASNPIILVSDKAIATKRKRNPTKRANPMIKYALVPDDGGFTFGMDDRTPVQFVFSNRDKVRGIYRSFALPKSVTSSPEFQQWASSLPGQSIIVSLNDLRKMLKRYI